MKKNTYLLASIIASTQVNAATITAVSGNPVGGEGYAYNVNLDSSNNDTSSFAGTVGSWSWEDESLPGAGNFWRHQSDWLAVTLTEDSILKIQAQRNDPMEDIKLFPSFTIYRNINDTTNGDHFSSNTSDVQWEAGSQLLTYLNHLNNSSDASIDESLVLPAGDYTILLGGNAESQITAENVNYFATLTAIPIPEPSSAILSLIAAMVSVARRKR